MVQKITQLITTVLTYNLSKTSYCFTDVALKNPLTKFKQGINHFKVCAAPTIF